jgi:glycosyltransferase involved in cell wall biosynthesis
VLDTRVVSGSGGGPDKTILNSPRFLAPLGYRMLCAYMYPPGDPGFELLRDKAKQWQAPLIGLHDRGPWEWTILGKLLQICRRERVAIWHGHDYKSNALGLLLRRFWPMKLVTTVHGWGKVGPRTPLYYWIDRLCLPHYEKVICVSPDLHEQALACGTPAGQCMLLENGIDTQEFRRRRSVAEAKQALGLPPGRLLIGSVGRLSDEKAFVLLIRSTVQLASAGHDVGLIIVGEGEQRPALEAVIHELSCGDRVQLLGYRADTRELYEAMDVFALSSLREGLPNVLLEAMAMEVPVVATRIAGIPRLLSDGKIGMLIQPANLGDLTDALTRMLGDANLRERFSQAGRQTIEASYSFQTRMQKLRSLYDELLGRSALLQPA